MRKILKMIKNRDFEKFVKVNVVETKNLLF